MLPFGVRRVKIVETRRGRVSAAQDVREKVRGTVAVRSQPDSPPLTLPLRAL